jgi:hypothetical protein
MIFQAPFSSKTKVCLPSTDHCPNTEHSKRPSNFGGPRPVNRLQTKNGYDLEHGDASGRPRQDIPPPPKRQKIDGPGEKHRQVLNLDSSQRTVSAQSGYSQNQNAQPSSRDSRKGSSDFHRIDDIVNGPKKTRRRKEQGIGGSPNKQFSDAPQKFLPPPTAKDHSVVRLDDADDNQPSSEDPTDPIIDDEELVVTRTRETPLPGLMHYNKDQEAKTKQQPEREGVPRVRRSRATELVSQTSHQADRRDSLDPLSVMNSQTLRPSRQRNGSTTERQGTPLPTSNKHEINESEDELDPDREANYGTPAKKLLLKRRRTKHEAAAKSQYIIDDGSSEETTNEANMTKVLFKSKKQNEAMRDEGFDVLQLFSQKRVYLSPETNTVWHLRHDIINKRLNVYDDKGIANKDLQISTTSFKRLFHNTQDGKFYLTKAADQSVESSSKIYLEFANPDNVNCFCKSLGPIEVIRKEV